MDFVLNSQNDLRELNTLFF